MKILKVKIKDCNKTYIKKATKKLQSNFDVMDKKLNDILKQNYYGFEKT